MDPNQNPLMQLHDFDPQDFAADTTHFDHQFVDLIRGSEHENPMLDFDLELISGSSFVDYPPFSHDPYPYMFNFNPIRAPDQNSTFKTLGSFDEEEMKAALDLEDDDGEEGSSGTTMNTATTKRRKGERSTTLISERRRRGRMKEKLHALRSLVPNITKMDKASIVGDAVSYVQHLQSQAKQLKAEIAGLEASMNGAEKYQGSTKNPNKIQVRPNQLIPKKIIQMDIFQVEERGFYMRLVCNKGEGVAMPLYRVLESLASFTVQSSNLATVSENFVLTTTLNVKDCEQNRDLQNLKLWVTGALLSHGFEFDSPFAAAA